MIPTEYLRQVPIRHHIQLYGIDRNSGALPAWGWEITGYKTQRAWAEYDSFNVDYFREAHKHDHGALLRGEEVEGFVWLDEPVKE